MTTHSTLGTMIDKGYRIAAHCEARVGPRPCGRFSWLDLPALASRLGRDHGAMHDDLVPLLKCAKCGSRDVSIRIHPPSKRVNAAENWGKIPAG